MRVAFALWAAAFLFVASPQSTAQAADRCPQFFAQGQAPELKNARLAAKVRPLCFSFFGILHSGVTRTPLWAAEHLTRDTLRRAACVERVNTFHVENRLPGSERAELSDFVGSGLDRGHLAPAADFPTDEAQNESFSLANIIPQEATLNRSLWLHVETTVSGLTMRYGETYVVTGTAFVGKNLQSLNGRVIVPTQVYKAIYIPALEQAAAYFVDNSDTPDLQVLSIRELSARTDVDPFPGLSAAVKTTAMKLPKPSNRGRPRCRPPYAPE